MDRQEDMKKYAPVAVFTYSRLNHLTETIEALKRNHLAKETDLFVISDGAKDEHAKRHVDALRNYVDSIVGFRSVNRVYRDRNLGAFQSCAIGESEILADYGRIISMEDDIVTSNNFLDFINSGLDFYEDCDQVATVAGYCHPIKVDRNSNSDSWFSPWHCPWGYGTWKTKYTRFDLNLNPLEKIKQTGNKYSLLKEYGDFIIDILESDKRGVVVATDARICGQMLLSESFTVMPSVSKVQNIGCDGSGQNTPATARFDTLLDDGRQRTFNFPSGRFDLESDAVKKYLRFMNGNSVDRIKRGSLRALRKIEVLRMLRNRFREITR
jgi:hypothetical protein